MSEKKESRQDARKLSRAELLEMLIAETRRAEELQTRIEELEARLEERAISVSEAGSLAEACIRVNGVYEATQKACDQYRDNITAWGEQYKAEMQAWAEKYKAEVIAWAENVKKAGGR